MNDYKKRCRLTAKNLMKEKQLKHVVYGIGEHVTGWENEMYKFDDDETFDSFINELFNKYGNIPVLAVHSF